MKPVDISLKAALLAGLCWSQTTTAAENQSNTPNAATSAQSDAESRARVLLTQLSREEKVGQLSQYFYFAQYPPLAKDVDAAIAAGRAGAVLFVTDPKLINRAQKIAVDQTPHGIPLLFGFDVIHGLHTIFPAPLGLAASWDPALVEKVQGIAASEARAVGVNWTFAPNVDVTLDPRWGRIFEGAGEDPYLGSAMAAAQVRGFQGAYIGAPEHIIAGPKHFAGYGAATGGRDYDEVEISDNQLWNLYFPPFKAAIDAGAGNIMSAYMPLNGVPATGNRWLLTEVLRHTWGFKGFVVADSDAVNSLTQHGFSKDPTDAAIRAFKAGVNMEMIPPKRPATMPNVLAAVAQGKITDAELDTAVLPILTMKYRMGLFEHPYVDETAAAKVWANPAHLTQARIAAEHSAVLLKNENALLPLDLRKLKSIAVIGPLADSARDTLGAWVFAMNKPQSSSILSGIRAKVGPKVRVQYSEGVRMPQRTFPSPFGAVDGTPPNRPPLDETNEIARAVGLASNADVSVLVLGESQEMSGETASRASFDLPGRQQELLDAVVATGNPVVLLLMSVRPLDLKDTRASAILDLWYPGSAGAAAAANLLFGDAVPSGKLPISWIRNAAQAPMTYAHFTSHDPGNADKRYWNGSNAPTYPFGYGLSYTDFAYSNLRVERPIYPVGAEVKVSVDLANTGQRSGDEVAQLYIHQQYGASARPVRELKGFQRVALEPGDRRTIQFTLRPEDLRYWSAASSDWVQDETVFDVWVGGSSAAGLHSNFTISGK